MRDLRGTVVSRFKWVHELDDGAEAELAEALNPATLRSWLPNATVLEHEMAHEVE